MVILTDEARIHANLDAWTTKNSDVTDTR
jgi:hypothetical protein